MNNQPAHIKSLLYIRKFEEALLSLFQAGQLNGTTHTCIGQEEIPVAVMPLLRDSDYVFSNHRGHGHYLARFDDPEGLLAEIMGKEGAVCGGVGGSQHIKRGHYFSTGIQGESIPVAVGVGLHLKNKGEGNIAVAFIGDGTWGQGAIYEALNMASLWQVPLMIVCENNSIAQSTPAEKNFAGSMELRAKAFNVDFCHFSDDCGVKEIQEILTSAIGKMRLDSKPLVVEVKTRRLAAHSKGDDTRTPREIEILFEKDWYSKILLEAPDFLSSLDKEVQTEVDILVKKVSSSPASGRIQEINVNRHPEMQFEGESFTQERILENLNRAFHLILAGDAYFIGEDILDPYGGAFKASKGLSTKFPEKVISTPISELGIAGVGNGLALSGQKVIVEFMFADFVFLAFDQIINFAAKTVTMYGERLDHPIIFRCPVGGHRGYGATHSQSVQKFFIGIPNLDLYELSPLHDCTTLLPLVLKIGNPSILFESKTLYPKDMLPTGDLNELFQHTKLDAWTSLVYIEKKADVIIICGGSLVNECLSIIKKMLLEHEINVHVINPFRIYPFDITNMMDFIDPATPIFIVEEGTSGGTWGAEISNVINDNFMGKNINIIQLCSKNSVIPSSRHLEDDVLISEDYIIESILKHI